MLMRFAATIVLALLGMITAAWADQRVALVVGNSSYQFVPRIANAQNDSRAIAALLRVEGFAVEEHANLGNDELRRVVRDFVGKTREAEVAVVYFAGHGIEIDGGNYLIPVDARLRTDLAVQDEALSLDRVLQVLEPARRLRLVILDACRDNPFLRTMTRTVATRAVARGLAQVEPSRPNTLVAFAAKAGSTAEDGSGDNSPFTTALLKHIAEPGLDVRLALGRVRDEVLDKTRNTQEPFVYGSLGGAVVTLSRAAVPAAAVNSDSAGDEARRDFAVAQKLGTLDGWDAFLSRYKEGYVTDVARKERERLAARTVIKPADAPAPATDAAKATPGAAFTPADRERVARSAARNKLALPDYSFEDSGYTTPEPLKKFIGVFASSVGFNGGSSQGMIIVTDVNAAGEAVGFFVYGAIPPTNPRGARPAGFVALRGTVDGDRLTFATPRAKVESTLGADNVLRLKIGETESLSSRITLAPLWTLAAPSAPAPGASAPPAVSANRTIERRPAPAAAAPKPSRRETRSAGPGGGRGGGGGGRGGGGGGGGDIYDHPRFSTCARQASARGMMGPGSGRRSFIRSCVGSG